MVTLDEVKKALNVDEPDYAEIANKFGEQALPHLKEIAKSDDILLASKAVYLSGEISNNNNLSVDIMKDASKNDKPEIRIAAIAALDTLLKKMTDPQSINITSINDMLNSLKNDQDPGVNKLVNKVLNSSGDKLSSAGNTKSQPS
jgi:hypothetical protein